MTLHFCSLVNSKGRNLPSEKGTLPLFALTIALSELEGLLCLFPLLHLYSHSYLSQPQLGKDSSEIGTLPCLIAQMIAVFELGQTECRVSSMFECKARSLNTGERGDVP